MINVGDNMKKFKKLFSSVLGMIVGVSTLSFSGCGDNGFAGDVLEHLGHELGPHAVFYGLEHAEGVGDGRFAHTYHIALLDGLRGFHVHTVHGHLSLLAGVCRHRAGLV